MWLKEKEGALLNYLQHCPLYLGNGDKLKVLLKGLYIEKGKIKVIIRVILKTLERDIFKHKATEIETTEIISWFSSCQL